jgi:ubiquinone/menaquinone biosynthesis C-methylase UbiE
MVDEPLQSVNKLTSAAPEPKSCDAQAVIAHRRGWRLLEVKLDEQQQQQQRDYYSRLAGEYDRRFRRENQNHLYKIGEIGRLLFAKGAGTEERLDVLELGCGTGIHAEFILREYSPRLGQLVLSDISKEMLAQARTRLAGFSNVRFLFSPAERVATDQLFDRVFVSGAMHHFSNAEQAIMEMRRHLRPCGIAVVCEPLITNPLNFLMAAKTREEWGQFRVTRRRVIELLAQCGFDVICNRVLHWKGSLLWPHTRLEQWHIFDSLAVMFLVAGQVSKLQP